MDVEAEQPDPILAAAPVPIPGLVVLRVAFKRLGSVLGAFARSCAVA